jgi:hypothetical protein
MMYTLIISILSVMVVILGFTTFNLLRKNEKAEDILVGYLDYLDKMSKVIEVADARLKKIDHRGTFQSDDEVGFFFDQIKNLQEILNEFKLRRY